jgi:hypothetical protein
MCARVCMYVYTQRLLNQIFRTACFSPFWPSSGHTGFLLLKHKAMYNLRNILLKIQNFKVFLQIFVKFQIKIFVHALKHV